MEALATSIAEATQSFADRGVIPGLDADLADITASRARQARITAEGRVATSRAVLASLLAISTESLVVEGELEPLRDVDAKARHAGDPQRPELQALEWEARSFEAKSRMYERQRIPSLTLSGFVQNDGFNERVLGVGLSFPIPLPSPVGRTYAGEISESRASARAVRAEVANAQSVLRRETVVALAELEARVGERDAITPDKYTRAETTLTTLSNEVKAGRISARDAFVAQQTLIDVLQGRVRARHAACLASVEVARTASLPLEDGEP
jgi:cobalt-zinc-cadmium efflux system outer membrane protein